ncbi:MAG: prepilin-type N-terminal cleavage/methylation domain-containing protein [Phycisphaerae bacterium]|nr:prepilin-type N-terminal cleavage/methylation domain-containing protein [Phycisphaerae bacterium]
MRSANTETGQPCRRDRTECHVIDHRSSFTNPSGFTLIELLVVISVIAVLMGVLLPALGAARKHARSVVCQSNLRAWGTTMNLYAQENEGRFPTDQTGTAGIWFLRGVFLGEDDPNADAGALHRFETKGIALCPMAVKPGSFPFGSVAYFGTTKGRVEGTAGSAFEAWEIARPTPAFRGSYGYNSWLFSGFSESPRPSRAGPLELDLLSFKGRADIPVMLDATCLWASPRETDLPPPEERYAGPLTMGMFAINRHSECINGLFLDWSVRRVGLKELWTLKWSHDFDRANRWTKAGGVKPEEWPEWMRGFKDY